MPPVEEGIVLEPRPPRSYRVTDVSRYLGRGLLDPDDMTSAIQQAIDDTPDGGVVYFPRGTYFVTWLRVAGRHCLTLAGDGCGSVLQWDPRWLADLPNWMIEFAGCTQLQVRDLSFHGGGLVSRDPGFKVALAVLSFCRGYRVQNTSFLDDEHAWVFGAPTRPGLLVADSAEGIVADSRFTHYGLQVDTCEGLDIVRNTFRKVASQAVLVRTASSGPVDADESFRVRDLRIVDNHIEDPMFAGIDLTPRSNWDLQPRGELGRVSIVGNTVLFTADHDPYTAIGIKLAWTRELPEVRVEDIVISENVVVNERPPGESRWQATGIYVSAYISDLISQSVDDFAKHEPPAVAFIDRLEVSRNSVVRFADAGVELLGIRGAKVSDNGVHECGQGISLLARETHVHSNRVLMFSIGRRGAGQPTGAYRLGSYGRNVVAGNVLLDGADGPFWESSELYTPLPDALHPLRDLAFETDLYGAFVVGWMWWWEPRGHDWEIAGEPAAVEENE